MILILLILFFNFLGASEPADQHLDKAPYEAWGIPDNTLNLKNGTYWSFREKDLAKLKKWKSDHVIHVTQNMNLASKYWYPLRLVNVTKDQSVAVAYYWFDRTETLFIQKKEKALITLSDGSKWSTQESKKWQEGEYVLVGVNNTYFTAKDCTHIIFNLEQENYIHANLSEPSEAQNEVSH